MSAKEADIWEILNYRKAMRAATGMLVDLPLCQRIVLECHRIPLNSVRGHGKSPGSYRKLPNWIGSKGCPIEKAKFVPINADKLPQAMSRWEKYIHEDAPDRLVHWLFSTRSSRPFILSWTATDAWGAC